MLTGRLTMEGNDVAALRTLLSQVGASQGANVDTREAAQYWASQVQEQMERRDLQTIAWILRDIADQRGVPTAERDRARYWAAYLEGRMAR